MKKSKIVIFDFTLRQGQSGTWLIVPISAMSDVTEGVKKFLSRLGLDRYYGMFIAKGFDSEGDISYLDQSDLDAMYIIDESDRGTLLRSGRYTD